MMRIILLVCSLLSVSANAVVADTIPSRFHGTYAYSGDVCDPGMLNAEFPFLIVGPTGVRSYEGYCAFTELSSATETELNISCSEEVEGEVFGQVSYSFSLSSGQRCDLQCSDPWPDACVSTSGLGPRSAQSGNANMITNAIIEFSATGSQQVFFDLIGGLQNVGFLPASEVWRADYVSTWVPASAERFMGFDIALLEHEFFDVNAGCCVSEGFGVIVFGEEDPSTLQDFAQQNGCSFSTYDNLDLLRLHAPQALNVRPEMIFNLSCRSPS